MAATKQPTGTISGTRPRTSRVLIVDDDTAAAGAMGTALALAYEVTVLSDATQAVALVADGARFDVILYDLTMHGMNGAEFFARLCAVSIRQAGRIVFLGGGTVPLGLAEFLSRVSNPCVQRPVDLEALRALVERRVAEELARNAPASSSQPGGSSQTG
jgi:DNA-binding NtrC family response regulator